MRKLYISLLFFATISGYAQAQTSSDQLKGTNPNPNAPANLSEPGLRPAQPAQYSSSELPQGQKGQFYVKDDKPVDAAGNPILPQAPRPSKADMLRNANSTGTPTQNQATKAKAGKAGTAAKPATKKSSK